jgi:hypothetical protein
VIYQISWQTLPGLKGISCSEFRATPTATPDYERGVAVELASETASETLIEQLEAHFEWRRFTNAADAFDIVKAYIIEHALHP